MSTAKNAYGTHSTQLGDVPVRSRVQVALHVHTLEAVHTCAYAKKQYNLLSE